MEFRIRRTRPGDELWRHVETHSPQTVGYIEDPNDLGDYRCFVATDAAHAFVGLCIIDIGPMRFGPLAHETVACLENILVLAPLRRQGIGSALLRTVLDEAWQGGARYVWWTVGYENTTGIAFYSSNGAVFVPEEDLQADPPERYYTALVVNPQSVT